MLLLLLLLPLASPTSPLHISSLLVPSWAYENSSISLSCTYSLAMSQFRELDIKWYHGASPSPLLVSLPSLGRNMVVAGSTLENHISLEENLVEESSNIQKKDMSEEISRIPRQEMVEEAAPISGEEMVEGSSTFMLRNLSVGLSGMISCKAATFTQESVVRKRLTVVRKPT